MVRCSISNPAVARTLIPVTEVRMNEFNIDPNEYRRLVREAERMRAEALADLLVRAGRGIARAAAAIGRWARNVNRRRNFNLSVPAPHR